MSKKQFSMEAYWNYLAAKWSPILSFKGESKDEFEAWKAQALEKLLELLGEFPQKVALEAESEYIVEDGDIVRERVVFDVDEYMSVPVIIIKPKNMKNDGTNAAILCSHGHGAYGKDPVAGIRSSEGHIKDIEEMNYNYAEQMARHGFLTISPDLRVFGERRDGFDPFINRDPCNVNFVKGAIFGIYTLTLNIWDFKCCIDYLETRPEVDKKRIGMMGLSQGGTMTTFTTAVEPRIKAADIIGYVNSFEEFGIKRANFCGSQVVPELYKYFDTWDVAGLIAPRPLLVEMGIFDSCFPIGHLLKGYEGIEKIYKAAGAVDSIDKDVHAGPHAFAGNKAFEFFKKNL